MKRANPIGWWLNDHETWVVELFLYLIDQEQTPSAALTIVRQAMHGYEAEHHRRLHVNSLLFHILTQTPLEVN